ncbi:MAG: ATP-binding protein, partial [Chloroflexota bacterium]|nr:ATP-binding protein [Chloroflexota bacterium]
MDLLRPFAIRTERVVGRAVEIEAIRKALADPKKRTHILYFTGPGGIGKTRLLEDSERLTSGTLRHDGIIDLYHSEFHSIAGFQAAIAQGLDPGEKYFQTYWKARRDFEERRTAGVAAKSLQVEEQEAHRCFLTDYNRLAGQYRILLRFDTTELIQHESDPVQQVCAIEKEGVEIQAW